MKGKAVAIGLLALSYIQVYLSLADLDLSPSDFFTYALIAIPIRMIWKLTEQEKTKGQSLVGGLSLVFLFPFGAALSSTLLICRLFLPPPTEGKGELGAEDVALFRLKPGQTPGLKNVVGQEVFLPAVSLLVSDDINVRRAAIDVLAQIGKPEQIELLQKCLDDPEREVYQYAHAKLTRLHEKFTDSIKEAQESGTNQTLLDRYLEYISSGLLGGATCDFYRQKAIGVAGKLLDSAPESLPILSILGRLYVDQNSFTEARLVLYKALAVDSDSVEARWELTRLAYKSRNFEEMRKHLAHLQQVGISPNTPIADAVCWWMEKEQADD